MKKLLISTSITSALLASGSIAFVLVSQSQNQNDSVERTTSVELMYSEKKEELQSKAIIVDGQVSFKMNFLLNILYPIICLILVVPLVLLIFHYAKKKYKTGKIIPKSPITNYSFIKSLNNEIIEDALGGTKITKEMLSETNQMFGPKKAEEKKEEIIRLSDTRKESE